MLSEEAAAAEGRQPVLLKVCPLVDLRRPRGPLDRYHRRRALRPRGGLQTPLPVT
jgi:hypothetical protein